MEQQFIQSASQYLKSSGLMLLLSILMWHCFTSAVWGQATYQQPVRNYQPAEPIIPMEHLPGKDEPKVAPLNPEKQALKRPNIAGDTSASTESRSKSGSPTSVLPAMACCLAIMMVFWLVTLSLKKKSPQFAPAIPSEALEFLGRKSIDLRSSIYYLRCGSRILIVGHSEAGLQTLGEVSDPLEVDIISGMCRAERSRESTISESFKTLFMRTEPQESAPMPTASLKDRLHKPSAANTTPPIMRDGRKIG